MEENNNSIAGKMIIQQQAEIIATFRDKIIPLYGMNFAKPLESLCRNETTVPGYGGFLSEQWNKCLSAGMQMVKGTLPPNYGWNNLANFWLTNKPYAPVGIWNCVDNDSALSKSTGMEGFLIFPSVEAFLMSLAYHIHNDKADNFGAWFSNDPIAQAKYSQILTTILPRFCMALEKSTTA